MKPRLHHLTYFPFPWMEKDQAELASEFDICEALLLHIDQRQSKN